MDQHILALARALRAAGVRISTAEAQDALRAALAVGVADRECFRSALRATLVKRSLDAELFEQLFELHFSPYGSRAADLPAAPPSPPALAPAEPLGGRPSPARLPPEALAELDERLRGLVERLVAFGGIELALLVRQAGAGHVDGLESFLQQGMVTRAILEDLGAGAGVDASLDRLAEALRRAGRSEEEARAWRDLLRDALDRLREVARAHVRHELDRVDAQQRRRRRQEELARRALGAVSPQEAAELARLVDRLGRKLDSLPELRTVARRRGALDMPRTWRANLGSDAVPFRLRHRAPRRRRPQVVALCDISSSVQSTVRFMLHFLYRLQDRFSRVRTFVFVSDTCEVTREFDEAEVDSAIDRALEPEQIRYQSSTSYGRSLERFAGEYPDAVTPRTILLVLGDARGNYTPARTDLLAELGRRARRLVWYNPESRASWGLGDSAMMEYAPHCTQVAEVRTLAQLEAAIEELAAPSAA